jgi:NTE family protein
MSEAARDLGGGRPRVALVLPGGGARSAYQVGVLRAIASWLPRDAPLPFQVLCGTSAGAINAVVLAAQGADMRRGAAGLVRVWGGFRIEHVFRAGASTMLRSGLHLFLALISGGWLLPMPRALLDNSPLAALLARHVDFSGLRRALLAGTPDSVAVTAASVTGGDSVTFVDSTHEYLPWQRAGRRGLAARLEASHLMASAAIPLLFPAAALGGEHFSDGAIRQATPLAPAIHLGAERILVISARRQSRIAQTGVPPNMAEQFGFMLDSLFMESLEADLERLQRVNALIARLPATAPTYGMRHIDTLLIQPERDFTEMVLAYRHDVPATLSALLRVLGARGTRGGRLLSYLLFESPWTRELIRLGEREASARRDEIAAFLGLAGATTETERRGPAARRSPRHRSPS